MFNGPVDQERDNLREDLDRVLLLLASEPRPGFETEFEELTRREVDRLLRPVSCAEEKGE